MIPIICAIYLCGVNFWLMKKYFNLIDEYSILYETHKKLILLNKMKVDINGQPITNQTMDFMQ